MDGGGDMIGGHYEIGADAYDDVQAALVALERKAVEQHSELISAIRNLSDIIDGRRRAVMQGQREARPLEAFDFHMFRGHKYVLQFSDGSGKRAPRSNRHFFSYGEGAVTERGQVLGRLLSPPPLMPWAGGSWARVSPSPLFPLLRPLPAAPVPDLPSHPSP